jgi:aldose 1-epimerase
VRPQPGYEWQLDLTVTYALDAAGLTVTAQAVNADQRRAPLGVGFHPYLTLGTIIDGFDLTIPASSYVDVAGSAGGPTMVPVSQTPFDFTAPRRIGSTRLDTAFGELVRDHDGRAVAVLEDADRGRSLRLWVNDAYRYLMVYTADQVDRPERRRLAIAVEPMTCPPDAFRTRTDLIELDPGAGWQGSWGLRFT